MKHRTIADDKKGFYAFSDYISSTSVKQEMSDSDAVLIEKVLIFTSR